MGRHLLMGLLSVIVMGVLVLAWQARSRLAAAAFGLILGGALGFAGSGFLRRNLVVNFPAQSRNSRSAEVCIVRL